jgi:transposase
VRFDHDRRLLFTCCLEEGLSVKKAAEIAGVSRRTVYHVREHDRDFAIDWDIAEDVAWERKAAVWWAIIFG